MYPGDARSKWPQTLLTDARVTHYWDESRSVGLRYLSSLAGMLLVRVPSTLTPSADAMWDALYLYGRDQRWVEPVPTPAAWGYPIMVTRTELAARIDAALAK